MSGWLIQGKTGLEASADFAAYAGGLELWFFELVKETHVPTRIYESENWQLTWFEYVGNQPEISRPDFAWDRLGPLPPDVHVNGTPLNETAHPAIWAVFGKGWGYSILQPALGRPPQDRFSGFTAQTIETCSYASRQPIPPPLVYL